MDERPHQVQLAAFERQMRRRRVFFLVLSAIGSLIVLGVSIALFVMRIGRWVDSGPPPPAIEVDISAAGRISVRDCLADDLQACVRNVVDREYNRPGGARHRALLHIEPGAPQDAIRTVRGTLLANDFIPEGH
jgi:hypothetical protein